MQKRRRCLYTPDSTHYSLLLIWVVFLVCVWKIYIWAGIDLPLWYDAGLYKRMVLETITLSHRDRNNVPWHVQTIYEPMSMMLWSTRVHGLGGWSDRYLTIGRIIIAIFLPLSVYILGKRYDPYIWLIAGLLTTVSLVQHHVYRRGYWKQLIWISMVCIILAYWRRVPIWALIAPVICALGINRASGILLGLWGISCCVIYIRQRLTSHTTISTTHTYNFKNITISAVIIASCVLMIYRQVMQEQIRPMLSPLWQSIDLPTTNDGYQASGTFLTLWEYIRLSWYTLIPWIIWLIYSLYRKKYIHITIPSVILVIRVFGQWFFFQRMIGYLDIYMILCSALLAYHITHEYQAIWRRSSGILLLTSASFMLYWSTRIAQALILPLEYQAIQELSQDLEKDAVVIVSWIRYSPWIAWWMPEAEAVAPWLFDHQQWWELDEWRQDHRQDQTWAEKCDNRYRDFPELRWRPTYIRVWSKQMPDIYTWDWSCIELIRDGKIWQRYILDPT